jgi:hypothetical protein
MTSRVFWSFFTYLVLLYNVRFGGYLGPPPPSLPTLISDVINEHSPTERDRQKLAIYYFEPSGFEKLSTVRYFLSSCIRHVEIDY